MGVDNLILWCPGNVRNFQQKMRESLQSRGRSQEAFSGSCVADWLSSLSVCEIAGLQVLISAYDHHTGEHALRTAALVAAVAGRMQCTQEEVAFSFLAALLHDIGKAAIPSLILCKPGPLDEQERKIMQLHPAIGRCMLLQAGGIFASVEHIVVAHHERWDGEGYPAGLIGKDIPRLARILSVVDSFDAMTASRAYQRRRSRTDARDELVLGAGHQYDPCIVAAFVALLDQEELDDHDETVGSERTKRNRVTGETEWVDAACVALSLRSDECARASV